MRRVLRPLQLQILFLRPDRPPKIHNEIFTNVTLQKFYKNGINVFSAGHLCGTNVLIAREMAKAEHKIRVDLGQLLTVVNDSLLVMSVTHVKNKQCSGYVQTMPVDFKTVSAMHEF